MLACKAKTKLKDDKHEAFKTKMKITRHDIITIILKKKVRSERF
jgi:hypothetical protein